MNDHPNALVSIFAKKGSGESVKLNVDGYPISTELLPEEIEALQFNVKPCKFMVAFELPALSVVPEINRTKRYANDLLIPTTTVYSDEQLLKLIGSAYQWYFLWTGNTAEKPLRYPLLLDGINAGELLQIEKSRRPSEELIVTEYFGTRSFRFEREGKMMAKVKSSKQKMILSLLAKANYLYLFTALIVSLKLLQLYLSYKLFRHLQYHGYKYLSFWQVEKLFFLLRHTAWRIPAYNDLATIPGVDPASPKSIAAFLKSSRKNLKD